MNAFQLHCRRLIYILDYTSSLLYLITVFDCTDHYATVGFINIDDLRKKKDIFERPR